MADPQPVVCTYLKLPPEQQPFYRIREIPLIFLEKLNRLGLALTAAHESHPCPEALQVLHGLREAAGDQCTYISGVLYYGHRFANRYLELLGALVRVSVGHETIINVLRVNNNAGLAAEEMEGAQNEMVKFRQDVVEAARRITEALNDNKKSPDITVFTTGNSQVVTELLDAVDECTTLFRQSGDYYKEIERQTENEQSIKYDPPSDEEVKMMQERWTVFYNGVAGLGQGLGALRNRIVDARDIQRVKGSYTNPQASGNAAPTSSPNPTDTPNGRKAILEVSDPSPSTKPKFPLWRSFLRHLFPCFTGKHVS